MKLDDLYNFYDGIIPLSKIDQSTDSREHHIRAIAEAAEKQFAKNIRQLRRNLCYMAGSQSYSRMMLKQMENNILMARNNAIKARGLSKI